MRNRKRIALLLLCVLALTSLSACQKKKTKNPEVQNAAQDKDNPGAPEEKGPKDNPEENEKNAEKEDTDSTQPEPPAVKRYLIDNASYSIALSLPEGVEFSKDLNEGQAEVSGIVNQRFVCFEPNVTYEDETSELYLDVYVSELTEEQGEMTDAAYHKQCLENYIVSQAVNHSDLSRAKDEEYNGRLFAVLKYTGVTAEGIAYNVIERVNAEKHMFTLIKTIEYSGSEHFVSYEKVKDRVTKTINSYECYKKIS